MQLDRRSMLAMAQAAMLAPAIGLPARSRAAMATGPVDRAEAAAVLQQIVTGCMAHAVRGDSALRLGETTALFDEVAAGLEGYSRLLWGVVPALQGGVPVAEVARLRQGLIAGTDPDGPFYWGALGDGANQRAVEMAAIGVALHDAPEHFLHPLTATERAQVFRWLEGITHCRLPRNNWVWFRILTLERLASAGHPIDRAVLEEDHALLASLRLERGWLRDGTYGGVDYYNPLAMHFYGLLFARWRGREEPERAARYVADARAFALDYRHWFTPEGEQLVYGRSLTYRFASVGFWGLLAEVGHPQMSTGEVRGLWSRAMRWWLGQPIWAEPGVPSIGYAYPDLLMAEFYNSPQSPLWMNKAFWPLALPAGHPFWTAAPEASPAAGSYTLATPPQMLRRFDGDPCLIPGYMNLEELRSYADKYGKFAYTARHGFCVESTRWLAQGYVGDNLLAFSANGQDWHARTAIEEGRLEGEWIVTRWTVPEAQVETRQRFTAGGEERNHRITAHAPVRFVATGHAVDDAWYGRAPDRLTRSDERSALAVGTTLWSDIVAGDPALIHVKLGCAPNTNLRHPAASVPAVTGQLPAGEHLLQTRLSWGRGAPPSV